MDIVSLLKNIGGILATLTTLIYVSGYLALRARAFALGTDPAFSLAYEGYVFAGFRFVYISLIILLLLSPVILSIRYCVSHISVSIPCRWLAFLQLLLLCIVAISTIAVTVAVFSASGVLLQHSTTNRNSLIEGAVMGDQVGIFLMLAVFLVTSLSVLWLKTRLPAGNDPFTWILGIVVAMQIFLLPIFYGSLYADRKVRVLAATPDSVKGLKMPYGIVDRTSGHVTLLGLDNDGRRGLVTIKVEDLNGIPVKSIVNLNKFVTNDLAHSREKGEVPMPQGKGGGTVRPDKKPEVKGVFKQLVDYFHVTFANIGSLGDNVVSSGQVWAVDFDASGTPAKPRRISTASNFAFPVRAPNAQIFAVQEGRVVRIGEDGESTTQIGSEKNWIKLIGVSGEGDIVGMVNRDDGPRIATMHSDGKITVNPAPRGDEERELMSLLEQENRAYAGHRTLQVERSTRGGRGFDVFYKRGGDVFNLSDCGDDRCGHPSFSSDFRTALYVRRSRY